MTKFKFKIGDKVRLKKSYIKACFTQHGHEEAEIIHIEKSSVVLHFPGSIIKRSKVTTWHTDLVSLELVKPSLVTLWDI